MRKLRAEEYKHIQQFQSFQLPFTVNTICPFCKVPVGFSIPWKSLGTLSSPDGYVIRSLCPLGFHLVAFTLIFKEQGSKDFDFYIYPEGTQRAPMNGILENEKLSDGVKRAYLSTLKVFNTGEMNSAGSNVRRTLEGITKSMLPEDLRSKPLSQQIECLKNKIDYSAPIAELSHIIREGGNISTHFDFEKETSLEVAEQMIDLLETLIEYIYILPERIDKLSNDIKKPEGQSSGSTNI